MSYFEEIYSYEQLSMRYENVNMGLVIYVKGLHVHHNYYQKGKLAWEYPESALTTLCWICHEDIHKQGVIDVYEEEGRLYNKYKYCKRCHGAGELPVFRHVEGGICFRCNEAKYEELI